MGETSPDGRRRDHPRRYAAFAMLCAAVLLIGGYLLTRGSGTTHTLGVIALGYGIGVGVSSLFLLAGWEPGRGRSGR